METVQQQIERLEKEIELHNMQYPYFEIHFIDGTQIDADVFCFDDEIFNLDEIKEIYLKEIPEEKRLK
jgi:hypothetical protein